MQRLSLGLVKPEPEVPEIQVQQVLKGKEPGKGPRYDCEVSPPGSDPFFSTSASLFSPG
jgi:hypothetical protein